MDETKRRKVGRLPKKDPAVFRYTISLNAVENDKFLSLYGSIIFAVWLTGLSTRKVVPALLHMKA